MDIFFLSLASGSSGNCYYIGTRKCGLLLDAGIGVRTIKKKLKEANIGLEAIRAVFLTHDHRDHFKGSSGLGEKYHIPIYATRKTHNALDKNASFIYKIETAKKIIEIDVPIKIANFTITAFPVPHDSTDCVGYTIETENTTIVLATDIGHITKEIQENIAKADYLIIEANHDVEMLNKGRYPLVLKERIKGDFGHISNREAAKCIAQNYTNKLKRIWLCHLSKDNNHPELARITIQQELQKKDIIIPIEPLKRNSLTGPFTLLQEE